MFESLSKIISQIATQDKILHYIAGQLIFCAAYIGFRNTIIALGVTFVIGCLKEFRDLLGDGSPEWEDILATMCGTIVPIFFLVF
jgi:hypothetical protein